MRLQTTSPPELELDDPATHDHNDWEHDPAAHGYIVFSLGASFDEPPLDGH